MITVAIGVGMILALILCVQAHRTRRPVRISVSIPLKTKGGH
jgi:hypothetical protein